MIYKFCPECGIKLAEITKTHYICEAGHHYFNNPKACVFVAFIKDEMMLVTTRAHEPYKGMHNLPGGFVDFGEDAYEAAIREMKEELTIDLRRDQLELLDVYRYSYMPGIETIDVGFLARSWEGEFKTTEEVTSFAWQPFSYAKDPSFCEPHNSNLDIQLQQCVGK